jgi:predicted MPP superfamily phosphohydrolase
MEKSELSSQTSGYKTSKDFVILLTHTPDYIEEPEANIANLALAGHTHGGQVTLFGLYAPVTASKYGMRYRTGLKHNRQGIPIIISNGLGTSRRPIRMFAPTDIVIVTLRCE